MTKHLGPILTLVAGLALAAVLMVLNLTVTKQNPDTSEAGNVADNALTVAVSTPAAAATTSAPAPTTPPPPENIEITYAGNVSGDGATLAIAIKNGKAVAYVCDGRSAEAWLQGTASGGALDLAGASDAKLTGTFGTGVAAGNVTAAGRQFAFSLTPVTPPSGLYRATANVRGAQLVGGWIVLANGKQVGLMKLAGNTVAAPPLDTASKTTTVDGTPVTARTVDGSGL